MSDNITLNVGAGGAVVGADDIAGVWYQRVKPGFGVDGSFTDVSPLLEFPVVVGGYQTRISQTPTISTSAYAAKDAIGGLLTFANAVRSAGWTGHIQTAIIVDKDGELAPIDLVLFDQTFTAPTDNAVFDPTDAELANVIAVIPFSNYAEFNDNAVCSRSGLGIAFKAEGTSIFGALVSRSTPTWTGTSDLIVILEIVQD